MPPSRRPFPFRLEFPPELPISVRAEEITAALQEHQVLILAGETGSGKTTQIPKMCLAAGRGSRGRIACTQPRRVAALSISRRVAEELGVAWGRDVGCKIRFQDRTTSRTVIKFLTDGMLLAELQGDPMLREYDTIIVDEAHERSLNVDFILGHLRSLRFRRPDLRIIITSATIDTAAFSAAFDSAPVVLVEGRTFPVEVIYSPLDALGRDGPDDDENADAEEADSRRAARAETLHYVDGAVEAVVRILDSEDGAGDGDILVFFPSERDIREAGELLKGRRLAGCEVVPLFGRLAQAGQERVFAATAGRKLILATNIAETSLTLPGIRYVVDTGLARMSRYSPQARTQRLPIEPISQASADQRKGRAGRVAGGICIRLYSEKDFLERPRFTQPEIQRANLADVILRMAAFGLGEIEDFPFINLPVARAVRAGYALLEEIGALAPATVEERGGVDGSAPARRELTRLGHELAQLPVDPTVGRMILQARTERALREVLVIASGLSIQDPRERPLERQAQADFAHRRFAHTDSDFLTLLNLWEAWHDEFEGLSQARLRRFCREHFLSYPRMREWRDIYGQLLDVLRERDDFQMSSVFDGARGAPSPVRPRRGREPAPATSPAWGTPEYRAIHRSILAGLLGNIAVRDDEKRVFLATHDRRVGIFPGSVLHRRDEVRRSPGGGPRRGAVKSNVKVARWILASEITETARLYARTCARLDPAWALELGAHLIRRSHREPFWDERGGRVAITQSSRLYGLELDRRAVGYGRINPSHATELFIREGLVNDTVTFPLDFLAHNREVRRKLEERLTRTRDPGFHNLDEAVYRFYAARLLPPGDPVAGGTGGPAVSSVAELVDLVRERRGAEPRFLFLEPEDLRDPESGPADEHAFPAVLPLENRALPLNYAYKPGQVDDGVSLVVNQGEAEALTPAALDWAVPGHLEAKAEHYLRALPKSLRVRLAGEAPRSASARVFAQRLASRSRLTGRRERLTEVLAAELGECLGVAVDPVIWRERPLPEHLRVRVRVVAADGREVCAGRELEEIRAGLASFGRAESAEAAARDAPEWRKARLEWETAPCTRWEFGDLPTRVVVSTRGGSVVYAYPGLLVESSAVRRRLFRTPEESWTSTRKGLGALLDHALGRDLGWLEKDLGALRDLGTLAATLKPLRELREQAFASVRDWATDPARVPARVPAIDPVAEAGLEKMVTAADFAAALERARADLRGLVPRMVDRLREILERRQALLVDANPYPDLPHDLDRLVPPDFLRAVPYERLAHLPRYLEAMKRRAERWRRDPRKDAARAAQLAPHAAAFEKLAMAHRPAAADAIGALRWLLEEYRVSLFAQELDTAEPVSAVKLERALAAAQGSVSPAPRADKPAAARPIAVTPVRKGKPTRLKSLGALDRMFKL